MINCPAVAPLVAHALRLAPHLVNRSGAVRSVGARVARSTDGALAVSYTIEGELARLRVPIPGPPRIGDGLWRHTCCECFIRPAEAPGYHEFNFSPSGEWAAYAFAKYREGGPLDDEALNPGIVVRRWEDSLELDASIPLGRLSHAHARGKLLLALSAVIEDDDGVLAYWALKHPPGKPDFHHPDAFTIAIGGLE